MTDVAYQQCINPACGAKVDIHDCRFACPDCDGLMDVSYQWKLIPIPRRLKAFAKRWAQRNEPLNFSGVWRFRELLKFAPDSDMVTLGEGQTLLQNARPLAGYLDIEPANIFLQYEGLNPSGSFKDNGMAEVRMRIGIMKKRSTRRLGAMTAQAPTSPRMEPEAPIIQPCRDKTPEATSREYAAAPATPKMV